MSTWAGRRRLFDSIRCIQDGVNICAQILSVRPRVPIGAGGKQVVVPAIAVAVVDELHGIHSCGEEVLSRPIGRRKLRRRRDDPVGYERKGKKAAGQALHRNIDGSAVIIRTRTPDWETSSEYQVVGEA